MNSIHRTLLTTATVFFTAPLLYAQASEQDIISQLRNLRSLSAEQRPVATIKLANEVRSLPASQKKVSLADALANLVTEGEQGADARQAVADALTQALAQSPVPAKNDQPPMPYMDLARLVRYEHVTATLNDPLYAKAGQVLADEEAEIEKADFTLRDLHGKKVTLSGLRGKIVLVNFWATWCGPCRLEMPDLDVIYTHYQQQGLVVLSVTDDDPIKVNSLIGRMGYHPPVLQDTDGKVNKLFHITGIPKTFVFNREGKLVGVAIDQCTQRQFFELLARTDLKP
jgi:thiol-disulfide isomerase/thioredoxin